jgi:hypothetical protein
MAMRTPTPELIDALRHDTAPAVRDRHVPRAIPRWGWALIWGAVIGAAVAIVERLTLE